MGVYFTHKKGRTVLNLVLLSTLMILIGYSSYASVTIRAAANPPMNSNNPSNPFALYSLLNRDQYGDKPLLYGPQFSAPTSGYKYKDVRYLDDDGKYKTVSIISGYEHPDEFMHLFPRMWNYAASKESYKSWSAYRTRTDYERDENGEIVRDEQDRSARFRTPDALGRRFGLRTAGNRGADVPREPQLFLHLPAQPHVLALFPLEFRGAPERHPAYRRDHHRRQLALGHQVDRRALPRAAGQPAGRNSE